MTFLITICIFYFFQWVCFIYSQEKKLKAKNVIKRLKGRLLQVQSSSQRRRNTFPPGPRVALPERKWRQELTHHPESWVAIFLLAQCCHPDNWETRQKELKVFLQLGTMPGYQNTYIKWSRFKLFTIKTELVGLKIQSFLVECLLKYTKPWIWPNTTYSGHGGRSLKLCRNRQTRNSRSSWAIVSLRLAWSQN